MSSKLIIGTITYGESTVKYLPYFLDSLKKQTFGDFDLIIADNSEEENNENKEIIEKVSLKVPFKIPFFWSGKNLGFAKAYNIIIEKAIKAGAEYLLVVNPDVVLDKDAVERMVGVLDSDEELGSVAPKILKWDYSESITPSSDRARINKTNLIDSCGIGLLPGLRFVDIGQGEKDEGQFDDSKILGPSGAAGMFRLSALEKISEKVPSREGCPEGGVCKYYFDELMFMYKEDCDLAYRLKLAGFKSKLVSNSIVYHDRTVSGKGESVMRIIKARKVKSKQEKKWSFLNQQIIYWKFWNTIDWKNKLVLIWHQVRLLGYMILFEQFLFLELGKLRKARRKSPAYRTGRKAYKVSN